MSGLDVRFGTRLFHQSKEATVRVGDLMKKRKSYDSTTPGFHESARAAGSSCRTSEGSNTRRDHRQPATRPGHSGSLRSGPTEHPGGGAGSRFHVTECPGPARDALGEALAGSGRGGFLSRGMVSLLQCTIVGLPAHAATDTGTGGVSGGYLATDSRSYALSGRETAAGFPGVE